MYLNYQQSDGHLVRENLDPVIISLLDCYVYKFLPPAISRWVFLACLLSEAHAEMVHKFKAVTVGFICPDLDSSK
jgi:hypothetical protein